MKTNEINSEEVGTMSLDEKMDYLDREIRLLHKFCLDSGYNPKQIEKSAEPFISTCKSTSRKRWMQRLMGLSILVAVFSALMYYDPAYRLVLATGRKATIKILPIWDWTKIWDTDCLIKNPIYSEETELSENDCEICKKLKSLDRVKNISRDVIIEDYLKNEKPVIVEDGTVDWPEDKIMTIDKLSHIYKTHHVLKLFVGCQFKCSGLNRHGNHKIFLQQLSDKKIKKGYAHWENCFKESAKAFRQYYKRPYFLPELVEITDTNWVFISSDYDMEEGESVEIPMESNAVLIMQVKGSMTIGLFPRSPCDEGKKCQDLTEVLEEGEIMVVPLTDLLWSLEYQTVPGKENVAIAIGMSYDQANM